jgi:hypothetical protein
VYNEQTQHYLCELIDVTWHCGFLRTAAIRHADDGFGVLVHALNEIPIAIVLRELLLEENAWGTGTIEAFVERTWPSVARLSIEAASEPLDAARIAAVLSRMPRLRHLSVWGTQNSDVLCEAIAASPIVSQLESIDLRKAVFTRAGIDALSTATLRSLKTLDLGATSIETRGRLQHLAPTVRVHPDG